MQFSYLILFVIILHFFDSEPHFYVDNIMNFVNICVFMMAVQSAENGGEVGIEY